MTSIVYEDEELQAFWLNGSSNFLLIAFGDLVSMANGQTFSVQGPASKSGIACLGIMAKRPNWYPRRNLQQLVSALSALLDPYKERILYGASMGGHGALKAGRLMQASTTIALCPQWSINPSDQTATPLGWSEYYNPETMADMAIEEADLRGAIFLISDPGEVRDEFHRQQITHRSDSVHQINAHFCDHNVTPVLSGTANFLEILTLCRSQSVIKLQATVNQLRRSHFFRKKALIERGLKAKRKLTVGVALRALRTDPLVNEIMRDLPRYLKDDLAADEVLGEMPEFVAYLLNDKTSAVEKFERALELPDHRNIEITLITPFGTNIFYDHKSKSLVHSPSATAGPGCAPVKLFLRNTRLEIYIEGRFTRLSLPRITGDVSLMEYDFEMREGPQGRVVLARNGLFLSADPSGTISCDRNEASQWEFFEVRVTAALL